MGIKTAPMLFHGRGEKPAKGSTWAQIVEQIIGCPAHRDGTGACFFQYHRPAVGLIAACILNISCMLQDQLQLYLMPPLLLPLAVMLAAVVLAQLPAVMSAVILARPLLTLPVDNRCVIKTTRKQLIT